MASEGTNTLRSTEKSIRIIEALKELNGAGVTELATYLDYNKSTVHHHLATLEQSELVVRESGTYKLGIRFFRIGEYTRRKREIYEIARSEVDRLAEETGEIANLMVEEHGRGTYLHIAKGEKAVTLDTSIGSTQYLHTCALGKAMMAVMPLSKVETIIDCHGLPAETPNTVTSQEELFNELETIRERGVAFDGEERAEAITCVATAVTDSEGHILGAISVSGPSSRMKGEFLNSELPDLITNSAEIVGINASYS
jgi:DNA-binding IclR family transcriptional regulator